MSRAVPTDHEFNKEKFAQLLVIAKGNRTQKMFADQCGISCAHLNRFYNIKKETPPNPNTIIKIANKSDISYDELIDAAGYDVKKYPRYGTDSETGESTRIDLENARMFNAYCFFHIFMKVQSLGLLCGREYCIEGFDLGFSEEKQPLLSLWQFLIESRKEIGLLDIIQLYGKICMSGLPQKAKITIMVPSDKAAKLIKENPPKSLQAYLSVAVYDLGDDKITKEEYVKTALNLPETLKTMYKLTED